jgi:hypothetical protein
VERMERMPQSSHLDIENLLESHPKGV